MCFMICRSRFLLLVDFGSIIFVTVLKFIAISKKKKHLCCYHCQITTIYIFSFSLYLSISLSQRQSNIAFMQTHFLSKMLQMQYAFCRSIDHNCVHSVSLNIHKLTHTHTPNTSSLSSSNIQHFIRSPYHTHNYAITSQLRFKRIYHKAHQIFRKSIYMKKTRYTHTFISIINQPHLFYMHLFFFLHFTFIWLSFCYRIWNWLLFPMKCHQNNIALIDIIILPNSSK